MEKKHFFIRLIPPRPSFQLDMTEDEKNLMLEHAGYWKELLEKDIALIYGPVFDPKGGYGMGIVEADDQAAVDALLLNDPTIKSDRHFAYEIFGMLAVRK